MLFFFPPKCLIGSALYEIGLYLKKREWGWSSLVPLSVERERIREWNILLMLLGIIRINEERRERDEVSDASRSQTSHGIAEE